MYKVLGLTQKNWKIIFIGLMSVNLVMVIIPLFIPAWLDQYQSDNDYAIGGLTSYHVESDFKKNTNDSYLIQDCDRDNDYNEICTQIRNFYHGGLAYIILGTISLVLIASVCSFLFVSILRFKVKKYLKLRYSSYVMIVACLIHLVGLLV